MTCHALQNAILRGLIVSWPALKKWLIKEPSGHGPDCPPVVVIVGDRTARTVLLL